MARVAESRGDTDLNVSSSVRDDEHFSFTMNRAVGRLQLRRQVIADSGGLLRDAARGHARSSLDGVK